MSQQSDFEIIKKAFKKGANGYLTKPVTRNRLFHALDSIQQYGAALGHDVAKMIISSFQRKPLKTFSKRENQIIEYHKLISLFNSLLEFWFSDLNFFKLMNALGAKITWEKEKT